MQNRLPNHAHFEELSDNGSGEQDVVLEGKINTLHAQGDPGSEFDISLIDSRGNETLVKKGCKNTTGRWGEMVNMELPENYYKVRVSKVKGTKSLDVFCD